MYLPFIPFILTIMSTKRKRGRGPIMMGDVALALEVIPKTIYESQKDGSIVSKEVWQPLNPATPDIPADVDKQRELSTQENQLDEILVPEPEQSNSNPRTRGTQQNYMQQYVDRVDEFLDALLSREAMPEGIRTCRHCNDSIAVWRCRDCVLGTPMCRTCMRRRHTEDPFHRIERWNGSYYRPADLSEVGTYLLIRHYTGDALCETLIDSCNLLDSAETTKDRHEQEMLRIHDPVPVPLPVPEPEFNMDDIRDADFDLDGDFNMDIDDDGEDLGDGDEEKEDLPDIPFPRRTGAGADAGVNPARAAGVYNNVCRVVHTNGLHHITIVRCTCHGDDVLPLDLFASQLLPASLIRIQTIFTAQVLDLFRLSNLELKASAYQFYQLLRRLTNPMAPADVINLYREFRRMSRIWRWMKKLKWAGYAGSSKKVAEVGAGELGIFCPACPQPGINLPDNWRDDLAKHVYIFNILFCLTNDSRWVFKRIFVADGNFKADHVRLLNGLEDVWLSEGSGMIPGRQEYFSFLADAIERLTVSNPRFMFLYAAGACPGARKYTSASYILAGIINAGQYNLQW
jgi:hypothetical protein